MCTARTAAAAFISCRLDYCSSLLYGLPHTLLRKPQSVPNATARLIIRRYYANSVGYPPESASRFASRCPGRRLSTWPTTTVSCPTALGALYGQLTFRLAWCRELSSYGDRTFAAAEHRLWNSLPVKLRNPDITYGLFRRQLKGHLFREA